MLTRGAVALFAIGLMPLGGTAALRIEIAQGESGNNNAMTALAERVAVRVVDSNGPVSGALVVFTPPENGPSVRFSASGPLGEATSDESGMAVSPGFLPVAENGPVEIRVMATRGGEFADAVIHRMNLGLHEREARQEELDIVQLAPKAGAGGPTPRSLPLRVRVETGGNRPVASAKVMVTLYSVAKSGITRELWRAAMDADEQGEAEFAAVRPAKTARLELVAEAEAGGRRATRYFKLKPSTAVK